MTGTSISAGRVNEARALVRDIQLDIARQRSAFFEKLALLDGSALTLSITLLTNLVSQQKLNTSTWLLHASWGLLLIGLAMSLGRNLVYQNYLSNSCFLDYIVRLLDNTDENLALLQSRSKGLSPSAAGYAASIVQLQERKKEWEDRHVFTTKISGRYWRLVQFTEWITCSSTFGGILLLGTFAVFNTSR